MIVKLFLLVAVPAGLVTVTDAVFDPRRIFGMVTLSLFLDTITYFAGVPWKVTDVGPVKFVPVTVSFMPGLPFDADSLTIVGTGTEIGRKPYLSIVAWPCVLSTRSMKACAACLFGLFDTIAIA